MDTQHRRHSPSPDSSKPRLAGACESTVEHISSEELDRIRGKKRHGQRLANEPGSVTVEYGGSFTIKSREFETREAEFRRQVHAKVLKRAAGRPILRERQGDDACQWLGPVREETEEFYIFGEGDLELRMRKNDSAAHTEPCPRCTDYPEYCDKGYGSDV